MQFKRNFITCELYLFLPHHATCGILIPQLGIESGLAVEEQSPNHWTTREFPISQRF